MSDLDLDDELLALTGDVDGAIDAVGSPDKPGRSRSVTPARETIEDKSPGGVQARSGSAQNRKPHDIQSASRRRRRSDESVDEGEASSPAASQGSLGSGAMSQSDSGDQAKTDGDFDEEAGLSYPMEGKFRDEKDKADIMAMPEFQREQILADRQEQALKEKQDAHLALLLKRQQESDARKADKRKRKASDADDGPRKASRTARSKQLEAVDAFKKRREQDLKDRESGPTKNQRSSSGRRGSDVDADGESDVEWAETTKPRVEAHAELRDYQHVRMGRTSFAKYCCFPKFDETVVGCFARACIGPNPETGRVEYRMSQIKGFETGKPYHMAGSNGRVFWVDQYLRLAHGSQVKVWPYTACSDSAFTEQEFNRWRIAVENDGLRPPSKAALKKIVDDMNSLVNRTWTDADIAEKIKKQNKLAHLNKTDNANGAVANVEHKPSTEGNRLHQLNIQNRKKNAEDVRKALIAEKRASAAARAAAKEREEAKKARAALQVPGDNMDDLFGSDISRAGTPGLGSGVGTPIRAGTPLGIKKEKRAGLPTFSKKVMDDEIIGSMDMSIEIDI